MLVEIVAVIGVIGLSALLLRNQAMLARSKDRLQYLADSVEEGLMVINAYKMITFANPAAERLLKYAHGELTGKTLHAIFPHHSETCLVCDAVTRGVKLHQDDCMLLTKTTDALSAEFTISPLFERGRTVSGAVVVFRDITERKLAQQALSEERALLRTMFATIPDPVYMKDPAGRYLMVNPTFVNMLGLTTEQEVIGKTIADLFAPEEAELIAATDRQLVETGEAVLGQEVFFKHLDMWASRSATLLRRESGELFGILGINRDITPLKRIEEQLLAINQELQDKNAQLAKLNADKDTFFSIISHDLRSPFNTLLGFVHLLSENLSRYTPDEIRQHVEKICNSAEILYALLENLLTWSRIQRGAMHCEPEPLDLLELVEDNLAIFLPKAEQKGITLTNTILAATHVYADYSMVNAILRNLISNALKFTQPGGTITLSATPQEQAIAVSVADTGTGIDAEGLMRVFRTDTHYTNIGTAGEPGTGLGLNLCKDLVEKNHGHIEVNSAVGQGTTFTFTLPTPVME